MNRDETIFKQNQFNKKDKGFFIIFTIGIFIGGLYYLIDGLIRSPKEEYFKVIVSVLTLTLFSLVVVYLFLVFLLVVFKEYKINICGNKIEFRRFPIYLKKKVYSANEISNFTKDYVSHTNPIASRVEGGYVYHFFTKEGKKYKITARTEEADKIDLALRGKI